MEMSAADEARYGAPQLTLHRADVLRALDDALPASAVKLGKRATTIADEDGGVAIRFADGTTERFDVLIGADGIHSAVRAALFGEEHPRFTGLVAYRPVVAAERLSVPGLGVFTKWWGPNPTSQIVVFPISAGREIFVFATTAQDDWQHESWTMPGSVAELRDSYAGFHPDALGVLDACEEVLKTALYERDPLPSWSRGGAVLLGDACHPMMPFMAQGAGMAIENAVVLARCIAEAASGESVSALRRYQAARHERASRIQIGSRGNEWLRGGGNADWVYGYDAWNVVLPEDANARD